MATQPVNEFFYNADFSEDATYTPPGGSAVTIRVIFDNEYVPTVVGDVVFENTGPVAYARTADVSDATNAATLTVGGVAYRVKETRPDGQGITQLILSKRSVA
jgi:hypothetical protein